MHNLLLTGAKGFIGNYFLKKYSDKYSINIFSFRNDSLTTLDLAQVDTVIHLSALVHQMGGATTEEYERINITQTLDLAHKAKKSGVKHFIFMSSIKACGEESSSVYSENSQCNPEDEYGKSKLKAEILLQKLEDKNFRFSVIRTPIVYGYGVKANIKNLISLVRKTILLPFASISNRRSMVYIGNLCHLLDVVVQKRQSAIFLAADDLPLSTTRLMELIAKELNIKLYLVKIPFFATLLKGVKPSFYKRLYESLEVDNSVTKKSLELTNLYTVEEGIHYMIHGEEQG